MIFGVNENILPADLKAKYPGVKLTRKFVSGIQSTTADLVTKVKNISQADWTAGLIPVVSFKTDPVLTANGSHDRQLTQLGDYLRTAPDIWIVWYHEPEDDMTGDQFAAAFKRVRDRLKASFPNVKVGYSAMAYQWGNVFHPNGEPHTVAPSAWRVIADFYGCDVYSGDSQPVQTTLSNHVGYRRWYDQIAFSAPLSSAIGLTERGWLGTHTDSQRASAIADEAGRLGGLDFYIYWNTTGTQNDPSLLNGPLATAALQKMIAGTQAPPSVPDYDRGFQAGYTKALGDVRAAVDGLD